jgi:hypothetical protein
LELEVSLDVGACPPSLRFGAVAPKPEAQAENLELSLQQLFLALHGVERSQRTNLSAPSRWKPINGRNFAPPPTRTKASERNAAFTRQNGRKGLCRLKPAFLGAGAKLRPINHKKIADLTMIS